MSDFQPLALRTLRMEPTTVFGQGRRALFIVCGYLEPQRSGDRGRSLPFAERLFHFALPASITENDRFLKNFYANPRDAAYMSAALRDFVLVNRIEARVDTVIDESLPDLANARTESAGAISVVDLLAPQTWEAGLLAELAGGRYDAVVLVFCDAIGLGCERVFRRVVNAPVQARFVINGRRRVFALDASLRRALAVRRFLARSRLIERLLAVAALPVGAMFALIDALSGRQPR